MPETHPEIDTDIDPAFGPEFDPELDGLHQTRTIIAVLSLALGLVAVVTVATVLIWRGAPPVVVAVAVGAVLGVAAIGWRLVFSVLDIGNHGGV